MSEQQKIKIDNIEYAIIDSIQDFRAEDSFIHRTNKLARFNGNGEAKKHIGTYSGELGAKMSQFFEYNTWGFEYKDRLSNKKTIEAAREFGAVVQDTTCFFSKSNLLKYLSDSKAEYYEQEQHYKNNISTFYNERCEAVKNLPTEHIFFSIYDASDNISETQNRGYIRSDDEIWKLWRQLILPGISYLSILKIIPLEETNPKPLFYFRILLDYQYRSFVHPSILAETEEITDTNATPINNLRRLNRIGQEKYRRQVIEYMPQCPFSKITDERLLIASHIKPYSVCIKENNQTEALDYLNGLSLSPTYDKLFDQGYITFKDTGELICGTQLSPFTWSKLNINPSAKNIINIMPHNRESYLAYHRKNIFQDNIEDLI